VLVEAPVEAGGDGVGQRAAEGGGRRLEADAQAEAKAEAEDDDGSEAHERADRRAGELHFHPKLRSRSRRLATAR